MTPFSGEDPDGRDSQPKEEAFAGASGGFAQFVEEHYQAAYRFALGMSGSHHDACDLTQQAFYLAQRRSDQLRDPSKRKQWLFAILYREFLHLRRRIIAHPEVNLEFSEPSLPHVRVDYAASLDGKLVLKALQTLDESHRMPLALFYLDQMSYKEIAETMDLPIGTVMSRLARGKAMLRLRLEPDADAHRPETKGGSRG
jgi:RNA polymerase sigma factor (sigma-70 family)